jgi:hypothetical protein
MSHIAAAPRGGKGWRRPDAATLPTHSDRLHELARRVERLGVAGRCDPETVTVEKFDVAHALRRLASEMRL